MKIFLKENEKESLQKEMKKEKIWNKKRRYKAILMLWERETLAEVWKICDVSLRTLLNREKVWYNWGLEGIKNIKLWWNNYSELDNVKDEVQKYIAENDIQTMKQLAERIRAELWIDKHFDWIRRWCKKNWMCRSKKWGWYLENVQVK